jgi:predicted nucleotidyltransferase/DNA-binding XRE family transcriptional regulator
VILATYWPYPGKTFVCGTLNIMAITFEALLSAEMAADPEFALEWSRLGVARTVAIALIAYRHKHQLSQGEMAKHMAVRPARVAELESGETNPRIETLAKIVATTGLEFAIDIAPAGQEPKLVRKAVRDRPTHTYVGASLRVGFALLQPDNDPPINLDWLRARRTEIVRCAASHGARNVRVFGSIARGEAGTTSDIDLLVEVEPGRSLLDLVGLWQDLEELLGGQVDVLSDRGLSPHLLDQLTAEAVPL